MPFEPEAEPDAGEEEAYAELEDGDVRPMLELDLIEDCSVDGVEEEGVIEEEVGVVAMLDVGEFAAFEDVGVTDEEEDGLSYPEEEDGVSPSLDMEPMF